ncbi:MAG: hypothetical protein U0992_10450 [Planctomycetaceae bacterium]
MACRKLRLSVLLLGVLFAASASLAADPRPIKVVAFGDSTTAPRNNIQQVYPRHAAAGVAQGQRPGRGN